MARLLTYQELHSLSRQDLERLQDERFSIYVREMLMPNSQHYRDLFRARKIDPERIRSISDWQAAGLPLFRKSEYREAVDSYCMSPESDEAGVRGYVNFCAAAGDLPEVVADQQFSRRRSVVRTDSVPSQVLADQLARGDQRAIAEASEYLYGVAGAFLTGGTSGQPTPVYHSRYDAALFAIANTRAFCYGARWLEEKGHRVIGANLCPHAPHQAWWAGNWSLDGVSHFKIGSSGGGVMPTERLVDVLSLFKVNIMIGMPSYFRNRVVPALQEAARAGQTFAPHMVVHVGAEPVLEVAREDIRRGLAEVGIEAKVMGGYGASELRYLVAYECTGTHGYHSMAPELGALRTVRLRSIDDWEFTEPGEPGALVYFPLDGTTSSLVGFILGDHTQMAAEPCPTCGTSSDTLVKLGRETDVSAQLTLMGTAESKVRGATVNLMDLREELLKLDVVREVQVIVERQDEADEASPDVLRLRVALDGPRGADEAAAVQAVAGATKRLTEVQPVVDIVGLAELQGQSLKFKPIVDARGSAPRG